MRKLILLFAIVLFCAATRASGQLRELKVVAQGSAKDSAKADDIARDSVQKKFDTIIRQELKSCDAPVQQELYFPQTGNSNVDLFRKKGSAVVYATATLTFTAQDHTAVVRAALDSFNVLQREKVLECISNRKLATNEKSP